MLNPAEIGAEGRNFVIRGLENLVPKVCLEKVDGAFLARAYELEQKGKSIEAANFFYTVFTTEKNRTSLRIEAGIGLGQMLINLGRFKQARNYLKEVRPQISLLTDNNDRLYWRARIEEKSAWIADYERNFRKEIEYLDDAKTWVTGIPEEKRGQREIELLSTITHFLGRAHFGLASQGIRRQENTTRAIEYFKNDLNRYQESRKAGEARPSSEGFNHAWLARCHLLSKNYRQAETEIDFAGQLFKEHTQAIPESGIMAHYHLLKGKLITETGQPKTARQEFEEALRIRLEVEPYPKGAAEAMVGIAWTYFAEGKYGAAFHYGLQAIKTYPYLPIL